MTPKTMQIGNHKYRIQTVTFMPRKGVMGTVQYDFGTIQLASHSNTTTKPYSKEQRQETFWHEVTHCILFALNSPKYEDEEFVDQIGGLLHQIITSMEF